MLHINNTFFSKNNICLCRELKLLVIPSTHLLEDHIISQMISVDGGITDKVEYHIGRSH